MGIKRLHGATAAPSDGGRHFTLTVCCRTAGAQVVLQEERLRNKGEKVKAWLKVGLSLDQASSRMARQHRLCPQFVCTN